MHVESSLPILLYIFCFTFFLSLSLLMIGYFLDIGHGG